jgi:CRP-like cAMP-binding protein
VVAHCEAGEGFGERGLLDNAPRNATVTTERDTTVLRIDGAVLLDVLEQAPMLTTALNRTLSGRGVVAEPESDAALVDDPRGVNA